MTKVYKDQIKNLYIYFILLFIVLIILTTMAILKPKHTWTKDVSQQEVIKTYNNLEREHVKNAISNALKIIFSQYTTEDFNRLNFINKKDYIDVESYINVRLLDGAIVTIGYFDNKGTFNTTIKKERTIKP